MMQQGGGEEVESNLAQEEHSPELCITCLLLKMQVALFLAHLEESSTSIQVRAR